MKTRRQTIRVFLSLCLWILLFDPGYSQISSPGADFSDSLGYPVFPGEDPFYVFHTPDGSGNAVLGALEASVLGGTGPYDFTWSLWDTVTGSFQPYFFENSPASSNIGNLGWGCYQVHISSLDTDTLFRAWVFLNNPRVEVEKDVDGKIIPYKYTCDYLVLNGIARADTILYYDLASNQALYLDNGMSFEWTDLSYQQSIQGNAALIVFPLSVLLVFLVLAALYESWTLPLAIILIVPMCVLFALTGVKLAGGDNNIFVQIGLAVLMGLACKNAILIVEFARELELDGKTPLQAAIEACQLRLRPIIMTSVAFIAGVIPMVFASGAGSEVRHVMGITVWESQQAASQAEAITTPAALTAGPPEAADGRPRARDGVWRAVG